MDTATATIINLTDHAKETNDMVWNILATERPETETDGLRWDLLSHWAELHHLTCGCDLRKPGRCHRPLAGELASWVADQPVAV